MNVIKKSYNPLRIRNEQNKVVGVRGNIIMNMLVPVIRTRL
jgi:hypothetical protein